MAGRTTRTVLILTAVGGALGLLFWLSRPAPIPEPAKGTPAAAAQEEKPPREARPRAVAAEPRPEAAAPEAAASAAALAPRGPGVEEAIHRFQFESMPFIDGCTGGPLPGARMPRRVIVRFARADVKDAGDTAGGERFVVSEAGLVPGSPTQGPGSPPGAVLACLRQLAGRELRLPPGALPLETTEFSQTIEMPMPVTGP